MAVKGLVFEIDGDLSKANKKVDEFFSALKAKVEANGLKIKVDVSAAGGTKTIQKTVEDEAAKAEAAMVKHKERIKALAEKAARDIEIVETRSGKSIVDERQRVLNEISKIEQDASNQSVANAKAMIASLKAEYTKHLQVLAQNAAEERKLLADAQKPSDTQKRMAESTKIQSDASNQLMAIETRAGMALLEKRQALNADLAEAAKRFQDGDLSNFKAYTQQRLLEYSKAIEQEKKILKDSAKPSESQTRDNEILEARKAALREIENLEIQSGRSLIKEREDAMKKIDDLSERYRRGDIDNLKAHHKQVTTEYNKQLQLDKQNIDNQYKARRDAAKKSEDEMKRRVAAELQILERSSFQMRAVEARMGVDLTQERQNTMNRIQQALLAGTNQSVSTVKREVDLMIIEYKRLAREKQVAMSTPTASSGVGGGDLIGGKNIQAMFQLQQIAEDFNYAGFRGISNNLAVLALSIGGPAGIIAMLGLMGMALKDIIPAFISWANGVEHVDKQIKSLSQTFDKFIEQQTKIDTIMSKGFGGTTDNQFNDLISQLKSTNEEYEKQRMKLQNISDLRQRMLDVGANAGAIVSGGGQFTPGVTIDGNMWQQSLERIGQILAMAKQINAEFRAAGEQEPFPIDETLTYTEQLRMLAQATANGWMSSNENVNKMNAAIQQTSGDIAKAKQTQDALRAAIKASAENVKEELTFRERQVQLMGTEEEKEKLRNQLIVKRLELLYQAGQAIGGAEGGSMMQSALDSLREEIALHEKNIAAIQREKAEKEAIAAGVQKYVDIMRDEMINIQQQSLQAEQNKLQAIQQQNNALDQQIAKSQSLIESLKNQKTNAIDQNDQKLFEAGLQNQVKAIKQQAEAMKQQQMFIAQKQGNVTMIAKIKSGEWGNAIDQQAMKATENLLNNATMKRVLDLQQQAGGAIKSGDFDRARKLLQQAEQLATNRSGSALDPKASMAFANQSKKINEELIKLFDKQIAAEQEKIKLAQQQKQDTKELEDNINKIKQTIDNMRDLDPVKLDAIERAKKLREEIERINMAQANKADLEKQRDNVKAELDKTKAAADDASDEANNSVERAEQDIRTRFGDDGTEAMWNSRNVMDNKTGVVTRSFDEGYVPTPQEIKALEEFNKLINSPELVQARVKWLQLREKAQEYKNKLTEISTALENMPDIKIDPITQDAINRVNQMTAALQALAAAQAAANMGGGGMPFGFPAGGLPSGGGGSGAPPGRAIGGPVSRNSPYIVGENGPELLIPNMNSYVVPNNYLNAIAQSMDSSTTRLLDASRMGGYGRSSTGGMSQSVANNRMAIGTMIINNSNGNTREPVSNLVRREVNNRLVRSVR